MMRQFKVKARTGETMLVTAETREQAVAAVGGLTDWEVASAGLEEKAPERQEPKTSAGRIAHRLLWLFLMLLAMMFGQFFMRQIFSMGGR